MKDKDIQLTLPEVEQLCRHYFNCDLSALEETELEYVLAHLPFTSELIEQTRAVMGVSRLSSAKTAIRTSVRRPLWRRRALMAAASIAVGLAIGLPLILNNSARSECYESFNCGHKLEPDQAKIHAIEQMKKMDRTFEKMDYIILEKQLQYENFNKNLAMYP
ncbi:MAG: hypothetical protein HDS99_02520 [Bacteroidales bacterium]|nr:hypothetical protein [Bacteroidales bacterium]